MVNQKEFKKLVWKNFWKQKWKEISNVLIYFISIIFVLYSVIGIPFILDYLLSNNRLFPKWTFISGIITTSFWIIVGLIYWIESNWELAKQNTEIEFAALELAR